jgi:hypothetical protein
MAQDDSIFRLARQIDTAKKNEHLHLNAQDAALLRRRGASELHAICADFASTVNSRLSEALIELTPPEYRVEMFRDTGPNLMQVGSEGRQIQLAFQSTPQLVSTEKFLTPYTLEGEIRSYNQRMLERFEIRTLALYYCLEQERPRWRFYEWRTRHTGTMGRELLVSIMESLFTL